MKEFFPNLTVSDEFFDDMFTKKEVISTTETIQEYDSQSIITNTSVIETVVPLDLILPVTEVTTVNNSVEVLSLD